VLIILPAVLWAAGCANVLERRFQAHIGFLASDALEGRGVGTPGIEAAAKYIAEQFGDLGLSPAGDDGTYFSTFSMTLRRELTDACRLAFSGDKEPRRVHEDFVPFSFSSDDAFDAGIVFCGFGISAPEKAYDGFDGVDLDGKVALMLRGEPTSWAGEDGVTTQHAMLRNKVYNAKDRGAVAVLFVNREPKDAEPDELPPFRGDGADAYGLPAFQITRAMADQMLTAAGMSTLDRLERQIDSGKTASGWLAHQTIRGQAGFKKVSAATRNVQAMLKGSGAHADEVVVIGAHYDHLGIREPIMRRFKDGKLVSERQPPRIHNGADDNASGVSGLLEVARLFVEGERPDRSILFVAFTAEESGLHGSQHYIESPPVPLDDTVTMLNMDMIGRMPSGSSTVSVFGATTGEGLADMVQAEGRWLWLKVLLTGDYGGRSDHAPFVRKKIPGMHFFTGQHRDYHQPSDDADRINAQGGAKVTTLVYRVADRIANLDRRPAFREVKAQGPKEQNDGPAPSYRVVMGLAPGYGDDGIDGMKVEAVTQEGPAEVAGMKAGDRIIEIGGKKVDNVYDYMAATRTNKPGDVVEVVVSRDGKEIKLQVTLASAR